MPEKAEQTKPYHGVLPPKPTPKLGDGMYKDGNPKTALGIRKPSDYYTPSIPYFEYSLAHMQGAFKYGPFNWRDDPISISTYLDAAKRHMDLFRAGQRNASDTGIHHLAHAMCCLSIIMDAEAHNSLIDDRFYYRDDTGQKKPYEILEAYIADAEPRTKRIYDEWFGHAERNKAKWAEAAKQNSGEKK